MKNLMITSALVMAFGLPAVSFAQTEAPLVADPMAEAQTDTQMMDGFVSSRSQSDMLATDLIGHGVYARRSGADTSATGTKMTSVTATELESMDNVGQINDIVLSADGKVQAVVIGVGGFIGVGERDVAVTMDQISFASDATNPGEMYIVISASSDILQSSPEFDRSASMDGSTDPAATTAMTTDAPDTMATDAPDTMAEREMLTAPELERDGYTRAAVGDMSVDMLIGKTVYGADDSNVGTVDDVMVDDAGAVKDVIIDFGGFLGMGTTQVALSFDELTILTDPGYGDVRVYVDATKEQVQSMPTYTPDI
jgi:sporulation protein YlmC with PRC-barrel domain